MYYISQSDFIPCNFEGGAGRDNNCLLSDSQRVPFERRKVRKHFFLKKI